MSSNLVTPNVNVVEYDKSQIVVLKLISKEIDKDMIQQLAEADEIMSAHEHGLALY